MTKDKEDTQEHQIANELAIIDSLLRSEAFATAIAESQNKAYYVGTGETPKPLLLPGDDTASVTINRRDEKIATNLAGFYALECGLGALCAQTNQKPTDLLQMITEHKADSATILLLNRFANATWKTGQPFRGLERIKRPIFTVASSLPDYELKKDYDQILAASVKVLSSMQPVQRRSTDEQMKTLRSLLQSESFAVDMAAYLAATYYAAQQKPVPPFLSPEAAKTTVTKPVKEQKIAQNVAGFYALECGLNYVVTTQQKRPSAILQAITDDTISETDKRLFCRFANATWKASQPFLGLDRITRATFTPFYFLAEAAIAKDWAQVKVAAILVLAAL